MITERDNSTDKWICPHCEIECYCTIIEDAVLKDDFKEILCGCHKCDGLFIRKYTLIDIIPLVRDEN